ncbi:AAA family ATPase [Candidatus Leptofilum sp.]|uniref:AAA family ATPase n=1 Tax=Candidatus Leptofilum sp. TaxID=3241576 RepID=UPI003B5C6D99
MLTRLKVSGFKNLVDVDVRFGPFTCIAGANGVGKSNLFDAILFLSELAGNTFLEAALSVRKSESGRTTNIRSLFHRTKNKDEEVMKFEAEMIIPAEGIDDLGQPAKASITFVRYKIALTFVEEGSLPSVGSLRLISEELEQINLRDAPKHLRFEHKASSWRKSAVKGRRTSPFISTEGESDNRTVRLHQDGNSGMPKTFLAQTLPRTVLSTVNATESPTALLARREMQSWRLLQLEPSALREPDEFTALPELGSDGSHLPATLYHLSKTHSKQESFKDSSTWIYDQVSSRLAELIDDVYAIEIDRDEKRQLLTVQVQDRYETIHPARSLSDGTLRFLALAVLEQDTRAGGVICLEEPENGIHPKRIPAILRLLEDIAVDAEEPVGKDNPLRQVIINTHSPVVVNQVNDDSLLIAEQKETVKNGDYFQSVRFSWLPDTWRSQADPNRLPVARGKVIDYLRQVIDFSDKSTHRQYVTKKKSTRVRDRFDLQPQPSLFLHEK